MIIREIQSIQGICVKKRGQRVCRDCGDTHATPQRHTHRKQGEGEWIDRKVREGKRRERSLG